MIVYGTIATTIYQWDSDQFIQSAKCNDYQLLHFPDLLFFPLFFPFPFFVVFFFPFLDFLVVLFDKIGVNVGNVGIGGKVGPGGNVGSGGKVGKGGNVGNGGNVRTAVKWDKKIIMIRTTHWINVSLWM